jgi:hypothetical protein
METVKKIICVGNHTADSDYRAKNIAKDYGIDFIARLDQNTWRQKGCGVVTPLLDLDLNTYRLAIQQSDVIIALDQSKESFENLESWQKIQTSCRWLSHFKKVIYENQNTNLYLINDLNVSNKFNCEIIDVKNNEQVFKEIYKHNLAHRQVVLQFMNLETQHQNEFLHEVDQIVFHCRQNSAKFVMFRASNHEPDPVHFEITLHLCQYPEFVLLKPVDFQNLEHTINHHWQHLYKCVSFFKSEVFSTILN